MQWYLLMNLQLYVMYVIIIGNLIIMSGNLLKREEIENMMWLL